MNGNAEDDNDIQFDENGNEIGKADVEAVVVPTVMIDKSLLHPNPELDAPPLVEFPRLLQPSRLEVLPEASREASRETSLHTPTVMGGASTNATLALLSQAKAENNKIEEDLKRLLELPLPTEKLSRPADLARDVDTKLDTLEKYWDEQRLTVGTVLKRMLWIVDNMVVKEREEGQKERRAQEMGWAEN